MNARQTKKCLKKQINKLQSDNDLMRRIIADSPAMQELYDAYNKPLNATCTTMMFQEYKSKRYLPPDRPYDAGLITLYRQALAEDLFEGIKEHINYETDAECMTPTITASVFVGIK
jgi:hypothetical protein